MSRTHLSSRKLRRKLAQDGVLSTVHASVETVYRREILPPVFSRVKKSGSVESLDVEGLQQIANKSVTSRFSAGETRRHVFEINDGYVFPVSGLCLSQEGQPISASLGTPELSDQFTVEALARVDFSGFLLTPRLILPFSSLPPAEKLSGPVCPLSPRYTNYYHWMVGTVPKLRYVEMYEERTGEDVTFLLPRALPSWGREILDLLGFPPEKFVTAEAGLYQADELIVPSHPFPGEASDYEWIRSRIFDEVYSDDFNDGSNIYISRSNAIGRRVVNEDAVVDTLLPYGFEKYRLEERSVRENIAAFANADAVVSPHGAGLTDIMFCRDAAVVELFGSRKNDAYEQLADLVGLTYKSINCQPEATDLRVDTDRLEAQVVSLLD